MIEKTIYLTEGQNSELEKIAKSIGKKGKNVDDLISEAIVQFIDKSKMEMILQKAAGLWKGRTDLPDFNKTRKEWDRKHEPE